MGVEVKYNNLNLELEYETDEFDGLVYPVSAVVDGVDIINMLSEDTISDISKLMRAEINGNND